MSDQAPEGQAPEGQAPEGQAPEDQVREGQAPEEPMLTLPEAAARLGLSETTLRRTLRMMPAYAARVQARARPTVTGARVSAAIPADLLRDLERHLQQARAQAVAAKSVNGAFGGGGGSSGFAEAPDRDAGAVGVGSPAPGESPSHTLHERLDALRREQIAALQQALDYERDLARRLTEALAESQRSLAREQALRSPAPVPPAPVPPVSEQAAPVAPVSEQAARTQGFWERLWRRLAD